MTTSRHGSSNNHSFELDMQITECWGCFYDKNYKDLELEMDKLRKLDGNAYASVRRDMEYSIDAEID